jgi:hypothetical protein
MEEDRQDRKQETEKERQLRPIRCNDGLWKNKILSDDDLARCEKFVAEFSEWLTNFRKEPPVVSDLSEQGWFLFIAAPLLVKEVRQRRIEYESEGRND